MTALSPDVVADLSARRTRRLQAELRAARDARTPAPKSCAAIAGMLGRCASARCSRSPRPPRACSVPPASPLRIAERRRWGRTFRVGAGAERIAAAGSAAQAPDRRPEPARHGLSRKPADPHSRHRQCRSGDGRLAGAAAGARRRHPHDVRHAASARGQGDRRAHRASRPACAFHRRRTRASAKLCRPGRHRHRERAAVQRDPGGAGAADRDLPTS